MWDMDPRLFQDQKTSSRIGTGFKTLSLSLLSMSVFFTLLTWGIRPSPTRSFRPLRRLPRVWSILAREGKTTFFQRRHPKSYGDLSAPVTVVGLSQLHRRSTVCAIEVPLSFWRGACCLKFFSLGTQADHLRLKLLRQRETIGRLKKKLSSYNAALGFLVAGCRGAQPHLPVVSHWSGNVLQAPQWQRRWLLASKGKDPSRYCRCRRRCCRCRQGGYGLRPSGQGGVKGVAGGCGCQLWSYSNCQGFQVPLLTEVTDSKDPARKNSFPQFPG